MVLNREIYTCRMAEVEKERCTDWSDKEIMVLIEEVTRDYKRLFQSLSKSWTAKKRNELWLAVSERVNSVGSCRREQEQVRQKWNNLKSQTISFRSRQKYPSTCDGPLETPEWWIEKVMNILEDHCPVILYGIGEGGESFTLASPKVIYDSDLTPLINSKCKKDMSITLPPAVCASTPLRASSSNTPGDVPTSQNSTSLLGHLNKKRKIQYNTQECTSKTKHMKMLQLLDSESQLMDMKIKLAQIQLTNAKLSQLKAYYELKTLENELAIPTAESVDKLIELDIAALL